MRWVVERRRPARPWHCPQSRLCCAEPGLAACRRLLLLGCGEPAALNEYDDFGALAVRANFDCDECAAVPGFRIGLGFGAAALGARSGISGLGGAATFRPEAAAFSFATSGKVR